MSNAAINNKDKYICEIKSKILFVSLSCYRLWLTEFSPLSLLVWDLLILCSLGHRASRLCHAPDLLDRPVLPSCVPKAFLLLPFKAPATLTHRPFVPFFHLSAH